MSESTTQKAKTFSLQSPVSRKPKTNLVEGGEAEADGELKEQKMRGCLVERVPCF